MLRKYGQRKNNFCSAKWTGIIICLISHKHLKGNAYKSVYKSWKVQLYEEEAALNLQ